MARPVPPRDAPAPRSKWGLRVALAAVLIGSAAIRLRLLDMPLERDEGEFAYMGQLILRGELPYVAAYNMKLPGAYYAYAAIEAAFGQSAAGVRVGMLLVSLLSIALVYRLGRRLLDPTAAVTAAAAYAVLSVSDAVLGLAGKAEHFVVPCVLGGLLLLLRPRPRVAAAGVLFGLAFVIKQHAAVFILLGVLVVARAGPRGGWRRPAAAAAVLVAGALLPYALLCLLMYGSGAFASFWFWTVTYARQYVTTFPPAEGLAVLHTNLWRLAGAAPGLWVLTAIGLTTPWWDTRARRAAPVLALFAGCALLSVVPGLRFSEHYFIMLLPAASLFAGAAVSALAVRAAAYDARLGPALAVALPLAAVAASLVAQRETLLLRSPDAVSRLVYGLNPFPESVAIADYLRQHALPGDRVAVIGSEPQIYFYSGQPAATSYIYMYPLMEPQPFARQMQAEMIAQLERAAPRFVVMVNVDTSWSRRGASHGLLFDWAERELNERYEAVGVAELVAGRATAYRWGAAAREGAPRSANYLVVFERRA